MEVEKNTAVITYIDENYEENLEKDFLYTLRNIALYKGKIVVIDYGMSKVIKNRIIKEYNVDIYSYKKDMAVFSLRNKHIPDVISKLNPIITNVMVIDGGDIWFQKSISSIFEATKNKIGCVEESIVFGKNEWIAKCLSILNDDIRSEILKYTNGQHVKNSGMVCGPRNCVSNILQKVYLKMLDCGIEYFGIDQLLFNYECCKLRKDKIIILNKEYNYVLVTNKGEYLIKDDKIYDKDLKLVTVVHNAGGKWRMINKTYGNKMIDDEQYSLNNIRVINS